MTSKLRAIVTATAILMGSTAATASAQNVYSQYTDYSNVFRPYIGVDYTIYDFAIGNPLETEETSRYTGLSPYVGIQLGQFFSVELGYNMADGETTDISAGQFISGQADTSFTGYSADLLMFLPFDRGGIFNLVLTGGVEKLTFETSGTLTNILSNTPVSLDSEAEAWGLRAGGGIHLQINKHLGIRAIARYHKLKMDDSTIDLEMDDFMTYGAGVNLRF